MLVLPFSADNFAEALHNKDHTPVELVKSKKHFHYLKNYLSSDDIDAKTIVIEKDYISKDFLHDYASYYAYCYKSYPKQCKRVHFFHNSFTKQEFEKIILLKDNDEFWKNYIGFITIKPIPVTIIGFTLLKTYSGSKDFNNRNFWGVRKFNAHIFGNKVQLSSLPFQEQDKVIAACATTAIWCMLNKAFEDFNTLKSPSQITKDADKIASDGSRLFPNNGLNLLQICQSILNSGLVSEVKQPDYIVKDKNDNPVPFISNQYLKKIINAYSPIGIPIILIISVPNEADYGLHAITISGLKLKAPQSIPPQEEVSWLSDNVEKFYAHDDQFGPFARIEFSGPIGLITEWTKIDAKKRETFATNIIVPLYPKIRISYEDIEAIVLGLDSIFTIFFDKKIIADLVWDIKIDFSENYKSLIKSSDLGRDKILNTITSALPKYIWIASCYIGEYKIFDFTFDATDVINGMIGIGAISYLEVSMVKELRKHLKINQEINKRFFPHFASINYYQFLLDHL